MLASPRRGLKGRSNHITLFKLHLFFLLLLNCLATPSFAYDMSASNYTDAVLLFGDSLTQAWSEGSIAQRMAEYYLRRLDVVNRGFGGYNSEWGIPAFEQIFATRQAREKGCAQNVKLMTIWFGANDACLPGVVQHVPLERFKANLAHIISLVRRPSSNYYSPDTKIVLITPPPVIESSRFERQNLRWKELGSKDPLPKLDRSARNTKIYAEAVVSVAQEEKVPCVDLWTSIVRDAGGDGDEQLRPYFYDGLHLTSAGYKVLFDKLTKLILTTWPELDPEAIEMRMPHHLDIDPNDPRVAFERNKKTMTTLTGERAKDEL